MKDSYRPPLLLLAALLLLGACRPYDHERRLMSFEEYVRISHPLPYVLRLTSGKGELLYFGARHTFDPTDPQVRQIEELWAEFRPTVAFNEGGKQTARPTAEAAVSELGEPGLVRFLAARDDVPALSLEPPPEAEIAFLSRFYSPVRLKLYYVLRQVPQFERSRSSTPVEKRVEERLHGLSTVPYLAGEPHTLAQFEALCRREFPELPSWRDVPASWFDPAPDQRYAYTNDITRRLSRFRDLHMMRLLLGKVEQGERVFAVVGGGHVVMQEPALRQHLWEARSPRPNPESVDARRHAS